MRRLGMLATGAVFALAGCRQPRVAPMPPPSPGAPRLLPPPPIVDFEAPDVPYRVVVALQLQPGWGQFLDDCRLRLPAGHPLNAMDLAAKAEIAVDATGQIAAVDVAPSGNADFDRAVRQVIADASPLPRPPRALWSDDDLVHLEWLFARDRRQAGPATGRVVRRDLPIVEVVAKLIGAKDLSRAAQRLQREPASSARDTATYALMVGALREAAAESTHGSVRRAAVEAIGRGNVRELAGVARDLFVSTSDIELQVQALDAAARLGDRAMVPLALEALRAHPDDDRRVVAAEVRTLVSLGAGTEAATILRDELARGSSPAPAALAAAALVPVPELRVPLLRWLRDGDVRVRAAACTAATQLPRREAASAFMRGLEDGDAIVRASCLDALAESSASDPRITARVRKLATDRDADVRSRAVAALAVLDPTHLPDASTDRATEVRAAYATALALAARGTTLHVDVDATLRALLDDREPDVRASAWRALTATTGAALAELAAHAVTDPAAPVRLAALPALDDETLLTRLATIDEAGDVRTAAIVLLAGRRGRAASTDVLVQRLGEAAPASAERVRTALAWLLAR